MIIDLTVVSIYTLCTSVLGATAHILTIKDVNKIKRTLKIQRMEISGLEAAAIISAAMSIIEKKIYQKRFSDIERSIACTGVSMDQRLDALTDRINNIDLSTLQMKQDELIKGMEEIKSSVSLSKKTENSDNK